jgi:hypothetical protein
MGQFETTARQAELSHDEGCFRGAADQSASEGELKRVLRKRKALALRPPHRPQRARSREAQALGLSERPAGGNTGKLTGGSPVRETS